MVGGSQMINGRILSRNHRRRRIAERTTVQVQTGHPIPLPGARPLEMKELVNEMSFTTSNTKTISFYG